MHSPLRPLAALACSLVLAACDSAEDPFASTADTSVGRDTGAPDTDGADTGVPDTTGADVPADVGATTCPDDVVFTGQVFAEDEDPLSPNGGAPRFEPWDSAYDAGLGAIVAAAPSSEDDTVSGTFTITEATVVATDYNSSATQRAQRSFWLGDGNATVQAFFRAEDTASQPTFSVKVGQRISGTATALGSYRGMPQITAATGDAWTLHSEDNEVYIRDVDGPLTIDDVNEVVRVTGAITGIESPDCGGSVCYEMQYGAGESVTLRSESEFVVVGGCVTFVGPVRAFGGAAQLDTLNFDWLWTYDTE